MNGRPELRELWLRGMADPVVGVFRPARPNGTEVMSIPGGGCGFVSIANEGIDLAKALKPRRHHRVRARLSPAKRRVGQRAGRALQDAQRAMRLTRFNAARYGIDPAKLGICGVSAGAHLAGSLTIAHDDPIHAPIDAADKQSARPAFNGLVYPVANIAAMNRGGPGQADGPMAVYRRYNVPTRVTPQTPPVFLAHSFDDPVVPIDQSLESLLPAAAKVPVEAHLFERGGHGWGALHAPTDSPQRVWTDLFRRWIGEHV